jgi:DNA-binding NtrC family response regulator
MEEFEILFVDDDKMILELVKEYLTAFDYRISTVDNGLEALELIKEKDFDVVFTDFRMPDIDGLELLAVIKEYRPETEVIIVTGHGTMESAVKAMKYGSYDYIQKPFKLDVLKILVDRIFAEKRLKRENIILKTRLKERHKFDSLIGISLKMQEIYEQIERMRERCANVLIQGESGTGKELTAQMIHRNSLRQHKPFITINCKGLVKGIAENEWYDQAVKLLQTSEGGTLFFNEIAEIMPGMQSEISRAYTVLNLHPETDGNPGGGVRILAATNRHVKDAIERQILNQEFISCLNEEIIQMPPLRSRKEDICLLINHFLDKFNSKSSKKVYAISTEALDVLLRYNWPGNVIQLENVIERAFALGVDLVIEEDDLPSEIKTFAEISKIS